MKYSQLFLLVAHLYLAAFYVAPWPWAAGALLSAAGMLLLSVAAGKDGA